MKHEPLKGKVLLWNQITGDIETTDGKYFLETKTEDARFFRIFLKKDVKSAVQGLLEEIENCMWLKALEDTYEGVYKLQPRKHIQELIKKWFPDVVEGEE